MPDKDFIAYLHELLGPLGRVSARAMFGGWGVYLDGIIVGIVVEGRLYLKADDVSQPRFADAGCGPFVYMTKDGPMAMSYWSVPDEALDAADAMAPWAKLALGAALRKASAKKPSPSAKAGQARPKPKSLARRDAETLPSKKKAARNLKVAKKAVKSAAMVRPSRSGKAPQD